MNFGHKVLSVSAEQWLSESRPPRYEAYKPSPPGSKPKHKPPENHRPKSRLHAGPPKSKHNIANYVDMTTAFPPSYPIPVYESNPGPVRTANYSFYPFAASDSNHHVSYAFPSKIPTKTRNSVRVGVPPPQNNSGYQIYEDLTQSQALPLLSFPNLIPVADKPIIARVPLSNDITDGRLKNHRQVYTFLTKNNSNNYGKKVDVTVPTQLANAKLKNA